MKKLILLLILSGTIYSVTSLTLSDFGMVPHGSKKTDLSGNKQVAPEHIVSMKPDSENSCTIKYSASDVFCNSNPIKSSSANRANTVSGSSANSIVPDNIGATSTFAPINIGSLQDERTRESMQKYNESFMIPLNPDKNINMKLNQQQVQINIKY